MLTLHTPIRLKSNRALGTLHEDMNEKIQANYDLMTNSIRKEELLYLTSSTPEVYFAEGSTTNILNEITSETRQNFRLDVINNLINRILVSNTENFSYQDQIYISNALRKLGITDVQQFMTQVRRLQEDRRETHNLFRMYEENKNMLVNILKSQSIEEKKTEEIENNEIREEEWHLHEDIYRRLNTSHIYEQVSDFITNNYNSDHRISMQEMNISEQSMLAQDFKLQDIRQEIFQKEEPFYLTHTNIYESGETAEELGETAEGMVSSAILLNLVNQIYGIRMNQIERNQHQWFQIAPALYNSAQNTWQRLEAGRTYENYEITQAVNQIQEIWDGRKEEVTVLEQMTTRMNELSQEWNLTHRESVDLTEQMLNQTQITNEGDSFRRTEERITDQTDINYLMEQEAEHVIDVSEATPEQLVEEIRRINERNVENVRQVQKIQREIPKIKDVRLDKHQARQLALRALEHPEEVIREVMEREIVTPQQELISYTQQQIYETLPEDTAELLQSIEKETSDRANQRQNTEQAQAALAQRAADIVLAENTVFPQPREQVVRNQAEVIRREEQFRNVSLIHKEEQVVEEELLNRIEQRTTETINRQENVIHNVIDTSRVETQINEQVNQIRKEQIENVEELVKQNVNRQIGRISDQVYGKIEKRLMTERRRRGF